MLVIYDCDGVLIDSEALSCQVLAELLGEHGIDISGDEATRRFAGLTDREVGERVSAETGRDLPDDFAEQASLRAIQAFEGRLQPIPWADQVLRADLHPRCVASNSMPARLDRALQIVGLHQHFPENGLLSSALVAAGKPSPDLHLLAAERFGAVPASCVVLEDSPAGVTAAVTAGMTAIGFVGAGHLSDRKAQAAVLRRNGAQEVIEDFRQFPAVLAGIEAAGR